MKIGIIFITHYVLGTVHAFCLSCLISPLQASCSVCFAIIFILLMSKLKLREVKRHRGQERSHQQEADWGYKSWPFGGYNEWLYPLNSNDSECGALSACSWASDKHGRFFIWLWIRVSSVVFCSRGRAAWHMANRNGRLNTNWKRDLLLRQSENRWW